MKDSNCNLHPLWDEAVRRAEADEAPPIDVRAGVRLALEAELKPEALQLAWDEALAMWFGGMRLRVLYATVAACLVAAAVLYPGGQLSDPDDGSLDEVSAFMDSGDWSEWL